MTPMDFEILKWRSRAIKIAWGAKYRLHVYMDSWEVQSFGLSVLWDSLKSWDVSKSNGGTFRKFLAWNIYREIRNCKNNKRRQFWSRKVELDFEPIARSRESPLDWEFIEKTVTPLQLKTIKQIYFEGETYKSAAGEYSFQAAQMRVQAGLKKLRIKSCQHQE